MPMGGISHFARKYNKNIFLDLKLHDIPKTVFQSIKSLEGLPINFLTIHLSGGKGNDQGGDGGKKSNYSRH